jgi:uncharacterized protein involved in exopolysaccharide biosynthesis
VPEAPGGDDMNPRYLDTYRQHRLLFLLPILIGMLLAVWTNLGKPDLYRSSTSLWSDTAGGSANDLTGAPPPAAQEQTTLNELLQTQYFPDAVARKGPLVNYLKTHASEGWGPGALVSKLRGGQSLDDRIAAALSPKRVTSLVLGPHVLKISYDGPTAEVAYGTVKTLVKEYESQRNALRTDALNAYRNAVIAASTALRDARTEIGAYTREHPGVSAGDPQMQSLIHAERNALDQLSGATQALNQTATSSVGSSQATLRIVDPPEIPTSASTTHKKFAFSIFAGLFVGALVSMLGIVGLTKTGRGGAVADVEVVRRAEPEPREAAHAQAQEAPRAVGDAAAGRRVHARRRKRPG